MFPRPKYIYSSSNWPVRRFEIWSWTDLLPTLSSDDAGLDMSRNSVMSNTTEILDVVRLMWPVWSKLTPIHCLPRPEMGGLESK